jgi:ankyrin repeat protein
LEKGDVAGSTPLHLAALKNHVEVLKALLEAGAGVNTRRMDGSTPLHLAALRGASSVVPALISSGANVEAVTKHNDSALELALANGNTEIVMLLFARSKSRWTKNTLFHALRLGNSEIIAQIFPEMLEVSGESVSRRIQQILPELLAELLHATEDTKSGAEEQTISKLLPLCEEDRAFFNMHLLMSNIKSGDDASLATSLLEKTPVVAKQVSLGGWTPLHLACRLGRTAIVKVLLNYGAQSQARFNGSGPTPGEMGKKFAPDSGVVRFIDRYNDIQRAIKAIQNTLSRGYVA